VGSFLRRTRVRLTLAYSGVFLVVASLAATAFWLTFGHIEYRSVDSSLRSQAQSVIAGLDLVAGRVTFNGSDTLPAATAQGIAVNALLVDPSGQVLDSSGSTPPSPLPAGLVSDISSTGREVVESVTLDGQPVRLFAQRVDLGNGSHAVLVLTRPLTEVRDALSDVALLLAGVVAGLTVVVSALGYRLAGRALRPVRVIADTAQHISEHDLHRRVELDLPADELGQLAKTFNGMLARLESAFASLQRFTADAAHELRAPLALLRAELEVSLNRLRSVDEYQASQRTVLAEVERLSRLADQLLILARADAGTLTPARTPVDLSDLVEEVVERWQPIARRKSVQLQADMPDQGSLEADSDLLRRLLDNLLDNAIRYTPADGVVRVSGTEDATQWRLLVADTGPGVEPALRAALFDRFTRADGARGRETGGAGLGLSLSQAIAAAHGGSIELADGDGAGATFVVSLPRSAHAD
jgi:heavy metal sensor kinase